MVRAFLPVLLLVPALGGCIVASVAKTAVDVVSIPVKVIGKGVDAVTTSQSEADEKRGRELRKADEQRAKEERLRAERCAMSRPLSGELCPGPTR
ncbi:MAG: hypothetical protein ABIR77_06335 [Sphingomicrobium sp.]